MSVFITILNTNREKLNYLITVYLAKNPFVLSIWVSDNCSVKCITFHGTIMMGGRWESSDCTQRIMSDASYWICVLGYLLAYPARYSALAYVLFVVKECDGLVHLNSNF